MKKNQRQTILLILQQSQWQRKKYLEKIGNYNSQRFIFILPQWLHKIRWSVCLKKVFCYRLAHKILRDKQSSLFCCSISDKEKHSFGKLVTMNNFFLHHWRWTKISWSVCPWKVFCCRQAYKILRDKLSCLFWNRVSDKEKHIFGKLVTITVKDLFLLSADASTK
jgi:hypothetical protein